MTLPGAEAFPRRLVSWLACVGRGGPGTVSDDGSLRLEGLRVLLTITTTHRPATDLGFLLHKNPERHQVTELSFGTAHVLYPEASEDRCCWRMTIWWRISPGSSEGQFIVVYPTCFRAPVVSSAVTPPPPT